MGWSKEKKKFQAQIRTRWKVFLDEFGGRFSANADAAAKVESRQKDTGRSMAVHRDDEHVPRQLDVQGGRGVAGEQVGAGRSGGFLGASVGRDENHTLVSDGVQFGTGLSIRAHAGLEDAAIRVVTDRAAFRVHGLKKFNNPQWLNSKFIAEKNFKPILNQLWPNFKPIMNQLWIRINYTVQCWLINNRTTQIPDGFYQIKKSHIKNNTDIFYFWFTFHTPHFQTKFVIFCCWNFEKLGKTFFHSFGLFDFV